MFCRVRDQGRPCFSVRGSVTAALRALGQDVAEPTVGISIAINNASILWLPNVATDPKDPNKLNINLLATGFDG